MGSGALHPHRILPSLRIPRPWAECGICEVLFTAHCVTQRSLIFGVAINLPSAPKSIPEAQIVGTAPETEGMEDSRCSMGKQTRVHPGETQGERGQGKKQHSWGSEAQKLLQEEDVLGKWTEAMKANLQLGFQKQSSLKIGSRDRKRHISDQLVFSPIVPTQDCSLQNILCRFHKCQLGRST